MRNRKAFNAATLDALESLLRRLAAISLVFLAPIFLSILMVGVIGVSGGDSANEVGVSNKAIDVLESVIVAYTILTIAVVILLVSSFLVAWIVDRNGDGQSDTTPNATSRGQP